MDKYSIILPNERAKTYNYVVVFVLVINLFQSLFIYFNTIDRRLSDLSLWAAVVCLFSFSMLLANRFAKRKYLFHIEMMFLVLGVFWFLMDRHLLGLCIFCFAVMGVYTRRKLEIVFSDDGILYPSFPKKIFRWIEISNVILKDGMLTIDLKNNKLIQVQIDKESAVDINEREFNLFCKSHLV